MSGLKRVLVVGAGFAGTLAARVLGAAGVEITHVDRGSEPHARPEGIILPPNATGALERLGVMGEVARHANPITAMSVLTATGQGIGVSNLASGLSGRKLSISHDGLLGVLRAGLLQETQYDVGLAAVQDGPDGVEVAFRGDALPTDRFDLVIAADGIDSARHGLRCFGEPDAADYSDAGVTTFQWITASDGLSPGDMPRCPTMMIEPRKLLSIIPLERGLLACTAQIFDPSKHLLSVDPNKYMIEHFSEFGGIVPHLLDGLPRSDGIKVGRAMTVSPGIRNGKTVAIGAAAHGHSDLPLHQGAALAAEDVESLCGFMRNLRVDDALPRHQDNRLARVKDTQAATAAFMKKWHNLLSPERPQQALEDFYADLERKGHPGAAFSQKLASDGYLAQLQQQFHELSQKDLQNADRPRAKMA